MILAVISDTGELRRRKRGYAGDLTPQLFMWADIDMYTPPPYKKI